MLYGISIALQLRAGLGLSPWDALNQGVSRHTGLSIGTVTIAIGALVLLLWIPLRQRPGLGTVSNVLVIGLAVDATLSVVPAPPGTLWVRIPLLLFAVVLCGVATGLYITPRFGPGPRDGLMTGLHRRTGRSVRLVRTCIEVTVLATGFALGGSVGVGTVLFAVTIGPLAQYFLRLFAGPEPSPVVAAGPSAASPATAAEEGAARGVPDPV
ncbi:YitT family protein [Streptomyces sp. C36]|uniref:membrane protein YczE n=1 Tax=Streptomyces sp. C36 TaxID=3237122 RepID=UPI0034C63D03